MKIISHTYKLTQCGPTLHNTSLKPSESQCEFSRPFAGEARPVFRRRADGRRLRGARLQGLPTLHLQIRAGEEEAGIVKVNKWQVQTHDQKQDLQRLPSQPGF